MGKYGRPRVTTATATITLKNMTEKTAAAYLKAARTYLQGTFSKTINPKDTDLLNIRDEILGDLNQLTYLFTLSQGIKLSEFMYNINLSNFVKIV